MLAKRYQITIWRENATTTDEFALAVGLCGRSRGSNGSQNLLIEWNMKRTDKSDKKRSIFHLESRVFLHAQRALCSRLFFFFCMSKRAHSIRSDSSRKGLSHKRMTLGKLSNRWQREKSGKGQSRCGEHCLVFILCLSYLSDSRFTFIGEEESLFPLLRRDFLYVTFNRFISAIRKSFTHIFEII